MKEPFGNAPLSGAEINNRPNRRAATVMVQGTASDVGKSLITAALCRIFAEDGYRTAPFKSQNMSLNSDVTWDGKEIGRAQAMQADACGVAATTDMNPILLKPTKEMASQVVVHGKPLREYEAREYRTHYLPTAERIVKESLERLRAAHDVVVLEGAGSPAEINLKDRDIVNMRMAAWADAPVILVADIDRGGVFASIVGTLELLEPDERDRVKGFVINKFRGDIKLLEPGLDWLEKRTGKPVLGVMPYMPGLELEDEDSLSLRAGSDGPEPPGPYEPTPPDMLDIAVLRLPRISNFTDMDPLRFESDVRLRYVEHVEQWGRPDAVIVPGSKSVMEDLAWLRKQGLAAKLAEYAASGGTIAGICGGYEMMGTRLLDPHGTESNVREMAALSLFPFETKFAEEKRTVRVQGMARLRLGLPGLPVEGYEIHMGRVRWLDQPKRQPFRIWEKSLAKNERSVSSFGGESASRGDNRTGTGGESAPEGGSGTVTGTGSGTDRAPGVPEGACTEDGRVWGTFIHGIFHNDDFRRHWLNGIRSDKGLEPVEAALRFRERREAAFGRLAGLARQHLDIGRIYRMTGLREEEDDI